MSPRSGVRWSVLAIVCAACAFGGGSSSAQTLPSATDAFVALPDPIARSPRLVGMGRLTLVVPDRHNRITLWDYSRNPAGLALDDSGSTLELRPLTSSASTVHDFSNVVASGERQSLAGRGTRLGYEAWRRIPGLSVVGAIGEVGEARVDRAYSPDFEQRSFSARPDIMAVVGGRIPYFWSPRLHYAMRVISGFESGNDEYRVVQSNGAGQYIDRDGTVGAPPDVFTPDEVDIETFGGGLSVAYQFGTFLTAAISGDALRHKISGLNNADRYVSERDETRPFGVWQASLLGRIGPGVEWGADARTWSSTSTQTWVFTASTNTGGAGAPPFAGRGDYLSREENGSILRGRARWSAGSLELGASFGSANREITLTPPAISDLNSFNNFLNSIFYRNRADTTVYPDSVVHTNRQERTWTAGGGASWRFAKRRGIVGAEYHVFESELEQAISGFKPKSAPTDPDPASWTFDEPGPRRTSWQLRSGVEYEVLPTLAVRGGYIRGFEDLDELTSQNERVTNTATVGFGLTPAGATWRVDGCYAFEWWQADFGDPTRPRGTQQLVTAEIGWAF